MTHSFATWGIVIACGLVACTGEGKPTTPEKAVSYTRDNVKRSVSDAPAEARRVGKRVTRAVGSKVSEGEGDAPEGDAPKDGGEPKKEATKDDGAKQ